MESSACIEAVNFGWAGTGLVAEAGVRQLEAGGRWNKGADVGERQDPDPGPKPDRDDEDTPETPPTDPPPVPVQEPPSAPGREGPYVVTG